MSYLKYHTHLKDYMFSAGGSRSGLSLALVVFVLALSIGCSANPLSLSQEYLFHNTEGPASNRLNEQPLTESTQGGDGQVESGTIVTGAVEPAVGLNKFDLFLQYLGHASGGRENGYQKASYQKVTQAMAEKAIADANNIGVTYLRVSATGYQPNAFNNIETGDLELWRDDPTAYWELFDQMMADLHSNGLQIVPVFLWNWTQFSAMTSETADQMINDPNSESYQLLEKYIAEFVDRYHDHPALYFYELTNELNLEADLDVVDRCSSDKSPPPRACEPLGNFSTDQMISFTGRLAAYVKSLDPDHLVSSGFSIPRLSAEHLRRKPEFSSEGPDWTPDSLEEFKKNLADIHAAVDIVSVHFYNTEGNNERFGITGRTNADLLDTVKQITDEMGKELFVGEFGDVDPYLKDDKNALFTQNVLDKVVELEIPYSAPWVWEYYESTPYSTYDSPNTFSNLEPGYTDLIIAKIQEANKELGNYVPTSQSPDTAPPQVVVTWPLEGWLSCDQLVHAVASDDSGSVSEVGFFVDETFETSVSIPPYQYSLDSARLGFGTHQITAKAYDPSGNMGQFSVSARPQICIRERLSRLLQQFL